VNTVYSEIYEGNTHPFIVRIWTEETATESGQVVWRGYITHVPSGKSQYFQTLNAIVDFIVPYLEAMGVKFTQVE
jgi:hypothetical protein